MSETKEQGEACADTPPSAERAKREYRSHVGPGKVAMDQLKEGDKVRFQKSATESPLWTIHEEKFDKQTGRRLYQLEKPDGSLYAQLVPREKLTLQT